MIFTNVCFTLVLFAFISSFSQGQVTNVTIEVADLDRIGLRFLFNLGAPTNASNCTDADFSIFDDAMYSEIFLGRRRKKALRALYPNYCANKCAGYVARQCRAVGCVGYRRRTLDEEEVLFFESSGVITESTPSFLVQCAEEKEEALVVIGSVSSTLSPSCQDLLSLPMDIQCFMYLN